MSQGEIFLLQYERAFGQKVNFEESSVSFSANVLDELRGVISELQAVPQKTQTSIYQGLPSLIGRNKKATFAFKLGTIDFCPKQVRRSF